MKRGEPICTERRRSAVGALLALWVVGFELSPFLHVVAHEALAPHSHGAEEPHFHRPGSPRAAGFGHFSEAVQAIYGATAADHGHDHHDAIGEHEIRVSERIDATHGDHSLAHRGMGVVQPPPAIGAFPGAEELPGPESATAPPAWRSRPLVPHPARGPPTVVES